MEASLSHGGAIDYHTFKEIGGHFLITPALTYQQSFSYAPDYIAQESMKESIDNFWESARGSSTSPATRNNAALVGFDGDHFSAADLGGSQAIVATRDGASVSLRSS